MCQLRISPELRTALEAEARRAIIGDTRPALATPDIDRALRDLKQWFLDEAISALEYESQRDALLASPLDSAPAGPPVDFDTLLAYLADLPSVLRAATRDEARAIIAPVLSHIWIKDRLLHAITPTSAFEPLLVGVWRTEVAMGCLTGFACPIQTSPGRSPCGTQCWQAHKPYQECARQFIADAEQPDLSSRILDLPTPTTCCLRNSATAFSRLLRQKRDRRFGRPAAFRHARLYYSKRLLTTFYVHFYPHTKG